LHLSKIVGCFNLIRAANHSGGIKDEDPNVFANKPIGFGRIARRIHFGGAAQPSHGSKFPYGDGEGW
jgi:hypothetical protein